MPELTIGFSLHETFPPLQRLSWMPRSWLEVMLKGMLGSDLISFRTQKCISHFLQSILMILDLEGEKNIIHYQNRLIKLETSSRSALETIDSEHQVTPMTDFIINLEEIKHRQKLFKTEFMNDYSKRDIYDAYRGSRNRMLLLDFEGTLIAGNSTPGKELLQLLGTLGRHKENDVLLTSSRSREWTDTNFGMLPISLLAENGAWFKPEKGDWSPVGEVQTHWKDQIYRLLEKYVHRCTGSFIVEKSFSLMWNYSQADAGEARLSAFELAGELDKVCDKTDFEIARDKKCIGIRQRNTGKEQLLKQAIDGKKYNFFFVVSNDRVDENVFKELRDADNAFTIKVGPEASFARYNLYTPQMVVSLLEGMSVLSREPVTQ
jgi:trehalose 6-phosphate synthase/phosphatase